MITIDRSYTIKFSYAGVSQYADFRESQGELIHPELFVSYMKVDSDEYKICQSIKTMTNINDILEAIKSIAYNNRAEIHFINYAPVFYDKKKKTQQRIKSMNDAYDKFIDQQLTDFFNAELLPIIKKNNWGIGRSGMGAYIIIAKDKNGEWNNVGKTTESNYKKEFQFEYLCAKALKSLDLIKKIDLRNEHGNYLFESSKLLCRINDIEKCGYYFET